MNHSHQFSTSVFTDYLRLTGQLRSMKETLESPQALLKRIHEENLQTTEEELQAATDEFRKTHNLISAPATHRWLTENHMTVDDLELMIEHRLLLQKLVKKCFGPNALRNRYRQDLEHYSQISVAIIYIQSMSHAEELHSRLSAEPTLFHDLARRHSQDTDSASAGGVLGTVKLAFLPKPIREAVLSNPGLGLLPKPIPIGTGFCIVTKFSKVEYIHLTPEIRDELFDKLLEERIFTNDIPRAEDN